MIEGILIVLIILFLGLAPSWLMIWCIDYKEWQTYYKFKCGKISRYNLEPICPGCGEKEIPIKIVARKNIFGMWEFKE